MQQRNIEHPQTKKLTELRPKHWVAFQKALADPDNNPDIKIILACCIGYKEQAQMSDAALHDSFEPILKYIEDSAAEKKHVSYSVDLFFSQDEKENNRFIRANRAIIENLIASQRISAVPGYHDNNIIIPDYQRDNNEEWETTLKKLNKFLDTKNAPKREQRNVDALNKAIEHDVEKFIKRTCPDEKPQDSQHRVAVENHLKGEIVYFLMQMARLEEKTGEDNGKPESRIRKKTFMLHEGPTLKSVRHILTNDTAKKFDRDPSSFTLLIFDSNMKPTKKMANLQLPSCGPHFSPIPLSSPSHSLPGSDDEESEEKIIAVKPEISGQTAFFKEVAGSERPSLEEQGSTAKVQVQDNASDEQSSLSLSPRRGEAADRNEELDNEAVVDPARSDDDSEGELVVDLDPVEINAKVQAGMEDQTQKFIEGLVALGYGAADLGIATAHFAFVAQINQIHLHYELQAKKQRFPGLCLFGGSSSNSSMKVKQQAQATGSSTSPSESFEAVPTRKTFNGVAVVVGK